MIGFPKGKITFRMFDESDLDSLHGGTLDVLENAGIRIRSEECLTLLEDAGCTVDRNDSSAKIPGNLIEEGIRKAKKNITLYARNPKYDIVLDGRRSYCCTDGNGTSVMDFDTGKRRMSTTKDLQTVGKVANALDSAHIFWPCVSCQDVPGHIRHVVDLKVSLGAIEKHVQVETTSHRREAEWLVQMGAALAGDEKALSRRPIFSSMHCPFSPLQLDGGSTEGALLLARAGVPISFYGMPQAGITGPVTLAGSIIVNNAEVLAGMTIAQLAAPGSPFIYGTGGAAFDMKTMTWAGGGPERALISSGAGELARHYGFPILCGGIVTSAKEPGPQSCYEKMSSGLPQFFTGCDMIAGLGLLDDVTMLSYEQMVIDDEMARIMGRLSGGVIVDDEHMAVDLIKKVNAGGSFLSHRHTMHWLHKEHFIPDITDRRTGEAWEADGSKNVVTRAREKAAKIMKDHQVQPLTTDVSTRFEEIVKEADADIKANGLN
ncbi:MAG: trimethylamine methyltransferase family protein [Candidatus Thermoplasmatota archaeon]|nr:trimethylamine methyltransferase family protein [Candidatus Thermoplasmatota archaeon]